MAEKYDTILRLAAETEKNVTADAESWFRFMDFTGRFIKYPFHEQLLIYAQRPDSRACASMKVWDSMGCWVNRGSKGIALIDTAASRPKLKYVFDMADVTPEKAKNGHLPYLWTVRPEHEKAVMEALENLYGKTDEQYPFGDRIGELVMEVAKDRYEKTAERLAGHVEGSLLDGMEKKKLQIMAYAMLVSSAMCVARSACGTGHHPAGYSFLELHYFNTPEVLHIIGDEVNTLVRPIISEIGRTVREYEKQKALVQGRQESEEEKNASVIQKSLASVPKREYNALKHESDMYNTGKRDTDKERGDIYGTGIQTGRGLPGTGSANGRTAGRGAEKVWPAAEKISDRERRSGVHDTSVRKQADEPPVHAAGTGGGADGADHEPDSGGNGSGRSAQGEGSDDLGPENEWHPADSGGDRSGRNDLHLKSDKDIEKKEKEPGNGHTPLSGFFQQNQQDGAKDSYEQMELFSMFSSQAGGMPLYSPDKGRIRFSAHKILQEQVDMILRTGGGRDDSRKRIYAKYQQGKTPEEMAEFLQKEYGVTGKGFTFGRDRTAVWFDAGGMRIGLGMSVRENLVLSMNWREIEGNIRSQIEKGVYMSASEVYLVDEAERSRIADCLFFFFRDGMGEMPEGLELARNNYSDVHGKIVGLLSEPDGAAVLARHMDMALRQLETGEKTLQYRLPMPKEELRAELDNLMLEKRVFPVAESVEISKEDFITQDEIDAALARGSGLEDGKYRIYDYFKEKHGDAEAAVFLKNEYGTGGRSHVFSDSDTCSEEHDSHGIRYRKGSLLEPYAEAALSWAMVRKYIQKLVNEGRYLCLGEMDAYAGYKKKQESEIGQKEPADEQTIYPGDKNKFPYDVVIENKHSGDVEKAMSKKSDHKVGDIVIIGGTEFIIENISDKEVQMRDPKLAYPIFRAESRENFERLIDRESGSVLQESGTGNGDENNPATHLERKTVSEVYKSAAVNFHITDDALGTGNVKEKYKRNVEVVRTLERIEAENRPATLEEQNILSQYVGWGGLADAFDSGKNAWAGEYQELKALLSPEEYASARESTLNAHYTSPTVIRSIYHVLEKMGFETGNILEPSMGVGNFFGMLPEKMQGSRLYGVELDDLTGRIAKQLYPGADIKITGFEKTDYPNDFFDIAIGNVPFGQYQVSDRKYDKSGFPVHEYFFAKALDQVRPGGVVAFVTSRWVMDKKTAETRKYLAQRAELLGAVRLPNNAFKDNAGTEVTADILFFQKLDRMAVKEPEWVQLSENEDGISMNRYFVEHPEMVVGKMAMVSGPYGMESTCQPDASRPFAERLMEAASHIRGSISTREFESPDGTETAIPADPDVKNFSYTVVANRVYYRENSIMTLSDVPETTEKRIRGMVQIRNCTQELIRLQMEECPDCDIREKQAELNVLYDNFTKSFGLLSSTGNKRAFSQDASYCLLCSLEKLDDEGNFKGKADMFTKRTIKRAEPVTSVDTAAEALAVSLSEKAGINLNYMAALCGKDTCEVTKELSGIIFQNPVTGVWENADEYLSGNVREKLRTAEVYAEDHPEYAINVQALRRVQPKELEAGEIDVRIGATWIEPHYIDDFMCDVLQAPRHLVECGMIKTGYSSVSGKWNIAGKNEDRGNTLSGMTYGTSRANAYKILEDALNLKDVRIYDITTDEDGREKRFLNKKETMLAGQKQEALREAFRNWVFEEPKRRQALCEKYNQMFNSTRPREYDGSHLKFPGMTPDIGLRPHQLNAVAHQLYGANTLLAHCVGAGKTFSMIAAAMEARRLGLSRKCLFVVPNHLTSQWASDFLRLYPGANILAAAKKDFEPANRKKFCSRIATGEYDAVIIGHSQFEKIPLSAQRQTEMINRQIDEIEDAIIEVKAENGERYTIKQMEAIKKSLYVRLERLNDSDKKDNVVTFEQLGIDRLFVDESHGYKNLFLYTKMRNVAGIAQSEAQKSSDMFAKCQYLDELTGGRGITFATGTPISNSMTEMYTNMRYLQYGTLQRLGLGMFDAWASTFGETVTAVELAPEGTGYRAKTRFSKFYNLPELMSIFKECADIQTADMLKLPIPEAHYENVALKPSEYQKEIVLSLAERAEKVRSNLVEPTRDNMLKITNDGRKLALDQRLVNSLLPDNENSKAAVCVENAYKIWENTKGQRSAQLIFCDLSTPKGDGTFNVYEDVRDRLVRKGVPEQEIAFIHSANTDARKSELFAKVRSGQVRFLLGSTQKMGAGTNVQDRLIALHHLDIPWRPADIEQQEGRILRQGNENKKVFIFRYVTEQTFDSYSWQLIENKQKFISQIMTGKSPVRSCEDIDESVLSYAEVKALATGNPYIKEKMTLDVEVAKLKMLKANFSSQKYRMEDNISVKYPRRIAELEEKIKGYRLDIQTYTQNRPADRESFSMTVGNTVYYSRKEAGRALIEMCRQASNYGETVIGEYLGFQMSVSQQFFSTKCLIHMTGSAGHVSEASSDPFGIIQKLDNVLEAIPKELNVMQCDLDNVRRQIETARQEVEKPFEKEQELAEKSARLAELDALLNMDESVEENLSGDAGRDQEEEIHLPDRTDSGQYTETMGKKAAASAAGSGRYETIQPETGGICPRPVRVQGGKEQERLPAGCLDKQAQMSYPKKNEAAIRQRIQRTDENREPGYMEVRTSVRQKLSAIRERRAAEQVQKQVQKPEMKKDRAAAL